MLDYTKIGSLIWQLRREKGLTQQQVAERLHISNKTVSKWERGRGCPDVSLWEDLASLLGADILKLLQGELTANRPDAGKIARLKFYVCPVCGNIITGTGTAAIACCGRQLRALSPAEHSAAHLPQIAEAEDEYYVTVEHEMLKEHYLLFAACVSDDSVWLKRLYPEQDPAFRLPRMHRGAKLYLYCTKHGLFRYDIKSLLSLDIR